MKNLTVATSLAELGDQKSNNIGDNKQNCKVKKYVHGTCADLNVATLRKEI